MKVKMMKLKKKIKEDRGKVIKEFFEEL